MTINNLRKKKTNAPHLGLIAIVIFLSSYVLNFVWESFHAAFLYTCCNFAPTKYVRVMSYASTMDGLLILGIYVIVSVLWKDLKWIKKMDKKQVWTFVIIGLLIAAIIEYKAVFIFQQWSYSSLMPTIFGIGLSPLVQLSTTGVLVLLLTRRLLY